MRACAAFGKGQVPGSCKDSIEPSVSYKRLGICWGAQQLVVFHTRLSDIHFLCTCWSHGHIDQLHNLFERPHTRWVSIRRFEKPRRTHPQRTDPPLRLQTGNAVSPKTTCLIDRFPAVHIAYDVNYHSKKPRLSRDSVHYVHALLHGVSFTISTDKSWIDNFVYITVLDGYREISFM